MRSAELATEKETPSRRDFRLLVVSQDFPPKRGGTQRYTLELARQFSRLSRDITVVVPGRRSRSCEPESHPFQLVRLPGQEDTLALRLARWLARGNLRFDAALCVQWPSVLTLQLLHLIRPRIRIYLTVHGREVLFEPYHDPVRNMLYRQSRHLSLRIAHHLFAVSGYTRELLIRQGLPAQSITRVPNGVDGEYFQPCDAETCRRRLGIQGDPVLLTLGRLVEAKGIQVLLESLPFLLAAFPRLQVIVGGDGPNRASLEDLRDRLGLAEQVSFAGELTDQNLITCFGACDLFVQPSLGREPDVEGFGIACLEAASCGRPVLASRTGGLVEAVEDGHSGRLVAAGRPERLAAGIEDLLHDRVALRRFGANGRLRTLHSFTWERCARLMIERMLTDRQAASS